MAECSYARCMQERRAIKKELQRWTKNMIFVVGLERVAEELMGKRKWKQYQETVLNQPLSVEVETEAQDWTAKDKCCFCDDGNFLYPSISPASESSNSSNSLGSGRESSPVPFESTPYSAMTTLESVTSIAAAVAAYATNANGPPTLPFYPPPHSGGLFPPWYLSTPPPQQPKAADPPAVMSLPASSIAEQPLDLSSKAVSPNTNSSTVCNREPTPQQSLKVPIVENKHIFKAKPRMTTVAGRRTYTEEELQAALRDIQSGKLGTRRAAVIYGIPRSTLRNKVYKLAMERERDSHLNITPTPVQADDIKEEFEDDKELSGGEDEREVEKALHKPLLSVDDLVRISLLENSGLTSAETLQTLLQHSEKLLEEGHKKYLDKDESKSSSTFFPLSQTTGEMWQGLEHSALGPYISQLLAASGAGLGHPDMSLAIQKQCSSVTSPSESSPSDMPSDILPKFPSPLLPELVRRIMAEEQLRRNKIENSSNDPTNLLLNGAHVDSCKSEEKGRVQRPPSVTSGKETEEASELDASASTSGMSTPPNVILKIPSFKPTSKNGVSSGGGSGSGCTEAPFSATTVPLILSSAFPGIPANPIGSAEPSSQIFGATNSNSNSSFNNSDSCSPPISNLTGKGIGVSLREVIAKSISQKFQQPGNSDILPISLSHKLLSSVDDQPPSKRSRFSSHGVNTPTLVASVIKHNNNNNNHLDDRNTQKISSGTKSSSGGNNSGKGTRPKRGKYRNYDRDSLIEAVKAVQRGEMSVHRAGSFYGVPHSTLEYKVKERHLMRPRKREPKNQQQQHPDDAKRKDDSSGNTIINSSNIPLSEKLKIPPKSPKPYAPNSPLANNPNGLKVPPIFDQNLSSLAAFTAASPFPFWPPNLFPPLPLPDFANPSAGFSPSPEQFFASQMMQRLQEESSRVHSNASPGISSVRSPPIVNTLGKSPREMAESLYDCGTNGSFLDGIIRSSLEMGLPPSATMPKNKMSNRALLDQLCRNSCLTPVPESPRTTETVGNAGEDADDDDSGKVKSAQSSQHTEEVSASQTVMDLSSISTLPLDYEERQCDEDDKCKLPVEEDQSLRSEDSKAETAETNHLSKEIEVGDHIPTNESACDSKTNKRVGDSVAAKDKTHDKDCEDDVRQ